MKAPAHCHLIHLFRLIHLIHLIRLFHPIHLNSTDSPDSPVSPDLPDSPDSPVFLQVLACKHLPTELLATPGERAGMLTQVPFNKSHFLSKSIETQVRFNNFLSISIEIMFQAAAMLEGLGDKKRLAEVKKIEFFDWFCGGGAACTNASSGNLLFFPP